MKHLIKKYEDEIKSLQEEYKFWIAGPAWFTQDGKIQALKKVVDDLNQQP